MANLLVESAAGQLAPNSVSSNKNEVYAFSDQVVRQNWAFRSVRSTTLLQERALGGLSLREVLKIAQLMAIMQHSEITFCAIGGKGAAKTSV